MSRQVTVDNQHYLIFQREHVTLPEPKAKPQSTPDRLFGASKLKVQRANEHIAHLCREVAVYKKESRYRVFVDHHSMPNVHRLVASRRYPPPNSWATLIGDTIHNLRSALDLLACDTMRLHNKGVSSVHFPFADKAENLEDTIRSRTVHRARPEVVNLFYSLRPYKGGDELLYGIHELDIQDKHKLLIPVVAASSLGRIDFKLANHPPTEISLVYLFSADEKEVCGLFVDSGLKPEFKYEEKPKFEVLFDIGGVRHKPVLPTLLQMSKLVNEIIVKFEECMTTPASG